MFAFQGLIWIFFWFGLLPGLRGSRTLRPHPDEADHGHVPLHASEDTCDSLVRWIAHVGTFRGVARTQILARALPAASLAFALAVTGRTHPGVPALWDSRDCESFGQRQLRRGGESAETMGRHPSARGQRDTY